MTKVCCPRVVKVRNANNTKRLKTLAEMLEHSGGSSKVFGITKRELGFRYWLVFAIVPLRTSTREKDESTYTSSRLKNHLSSDGGSKKELGTKAKIVLTQAAFNRV